VIRNGADPEFFYPADREGKQIGHVSWSIGESKRFDLLYSLSKAIRKNSFCLWETIKNRPMTSENSKM
jgi:hypothetical protein